MLFARRQIASAIGGLLLVVGLQACRSVPTAGPPTPGSAIDGTWEGSLRFGGLSEDGQGWKWLEETSGLRLVVRGESVDVYLNDGESWLRVDKPFRRTSHRTNTVISAIDDGQDQDGSWVETLTLAVSQINWRTLEVTLSRQVNNEQMARDEPDAVWWQFGYGTVALQGAGP